MAENIVLNGDFRDNITPKLKKLNTEINNVVKGFTKLQKKLRPVAKEMGNLAAASERVTDSLKMQKSLIDQNARSWSNYKREVGQAGAAQRRAFKGAPRGGTTAPKIPGARPTRGGGSVAAAVGGGVFGMGLSNMLTGAIISGFQAGVSLMYKPFQFLANGLGERIQDEMSDVRAAGGLFSISQRMNEPFLQSFAEAEELTKAQNRYLAQLAGALPGDTQEYINVAKQISDGVYTVIAQDKDNAIALGQQLARERGADTSKFATGGAEAMRSAGMEIVGEMTKLTVLAGLGGQQGAFGLPQLTEQMIARDEVTMGQFQRYAAIFRDPMIKGALERNIANINAAGKNTTARLEAIRQTFKEVVTPELVRRYQRTTSGVLEALKTTFLNPEVGLLGLGRPLGFASKSFNEFGEELFTLTKSVKINGKELEVGSKVTAKALRESGYSLNEVAKAASDNLSIFDYLRDIFANVMIVLQPVIEAATALFDPFTKLGMSLDKIREATMLFQRSFEQYRGGLTEIAKGLEGEKKATFESTLTLRAALAAINNAFANLGVYGDKEFSRIAKILVDPTKGMAEFQKVIQGMINQFLNSDGARKIGEAIGGIIGTVVATVGNVMAQLAGIATAGPLADGFFKGFEAAGGKEGIANIIQSVFKLIGKGILEVFTAAPFETSLVAGLVLLGPAIAGAIGTAVLGAIPKMLPKVTKPLTDTSSSVTRRGAERAPGRARIAASKGASNVMSRGKNVAQAAKTWTETAKAAKPMQRFAMGLKTVSKRIPLIGAAITTVTRLLEGKGILDAISGGLSSAGGAAIGAAIGTVIFPGVGTAIGALIGGIIGELQPVVDVVNGIIQGFGAVLGGVMDTLGPIFQSVGDIAMSLFGSIGSILSIFNPFASSINAASESMDLIAGVITAIKVILWPIVGAFQLLEQVLNVIVVAFQGLEVGLLGLRLVLSKMNPFADKTAQKHLEKKFKEAQDRLGKSVNRFAESFERHSKYYQSEKKKEAKAQAKTSTGMAIQSSAGKVKGPEMSGAWSNFTNFFTKTIPAEWDKAVNSTKATLSKIWGDLTSFMSKVSSMLKAEVDKLGKFFTETLPYAIGFAIGKAARLITDAWQALTKLFNETLPNAIGSAIQKSISFIQSSWDNLVTFFVDTLPYAVGFAIGKFVRFITDSWKAFTKVLTETIPNAVESAVRKVVEFSTNTWQGFTKLLTETIPNAVKSAVGTVVGFITSAWQAFTKVLTETIPNAVESAVGAVVSFVNNAWKGFTKLLIEDLPFAIGFAIGKAVTFVKDAWQKLVNLVTVTIPQAWTSAIAALKSVLSSVWQGLVNFFTVTIPQAWNSAITAVKSVLSSVWQGLVNFFTVTIPQVWSNAVTTVRAILLSAWQGLVNFFTVTIPQAWNTAITAVMSVLSFVWTGLVNFFTVTIPQAWNTAITAVMSVLSSVWQGLVNFFTNTIPNLFSSAITTLTSLLSRAVSGLVAWFMALPSTIGTAITNFLTYAATIPAMIGESFMAIGNAIVEWVKGIPGRVAASFGAGFLAGSSGNGNTTAIPKYNGGGRSMPLGQAISTEMKNKPPGSGLVIANTSETVIPAYKGHFPDPKVISAVPAFTGYTPKAPEAVPAFTGYVPEAPEAVAAFTGYVPEAPEAVAAFTSYTPKAPEAVAAFTGYVPEVPKAVPAYVGYSENTTKAQTLTATPAFSGMNANDFRSSSSEVSAKSGGLGEINMGGVTVNVSGVNDPEAIANEVADQILVSIRRASYAELDIT